MNTLKIAEYWHAEEGGFVRCDLCPHHCRLREGQKGRCKVRAVLEGQLLALGYGLVSSAHVDPIEKKPLYHFCPGVPIYSLGGWGCNFGCTFCQNWSISQAFHNSQPPLRPDRVPLNMRREDCNLVAYTYNEPLVGFEFVRDTSRLVREAGGKNVLVTNGYVEEAPAAELLPLTDALNVDIKSMEDSFYRSTCKGTLSPVLRFCKQAVKVGCHLEITNLIIPGLNDTEAGFERLAGWIHDELGPLTPLHLSAYHQDYKQEAPATPLPTLLRAREICRLKLSYVYTGNVADSHGQNTCCPSCGAVLIERWGFQSKYSDLRDGACSRCGRKADIIDYSSSVVSVVASAL
ncbi:MAG: AmmeMemoRadiSam system radical SAM enzyme [bacterium]